MREENVKNIDRRSFLKWTSLFGWTALAATASGCANVLLSKDKESAVQDLKNGPVIVTDASLGGHCRVTATQDFLLDNPINVVDGQRVLWEITQDSVGAHKITFGNQFVFGADLPLLKVVLTETPHQRDFLTAMYNKATGKWYVLAFIRGYA